MYCNLCRGISAEFEVHDYKDRLERLACNRDIDQEMLDWEGRLMYVDERGTNLKDVLRGLIQLL